MRDFKTTSELSYSLKVKPTNFISSKFYPGTYNSLNIYLFIYSLKILKLNIILSIFNNIKKKN